MEMSQKCGNVWVWNQSRQGGRCRDWTDVAGSKTNQSWPFLEIEWVGRSVCVCVCVSEEGRESEWRIWLCKIKHSNLCPAQKPLVCVCLYMCQYMCGFVDLCVFINQTVVSVCVMWPLLLHSHPSVHLSPVFFYDQTLHKVTDRYDAPSHYKPYPLQARLFSLTHCTHPLCQWNAFIRI